MSIEQKGGDNFYTKAPMSKIVEHPNESIPTTSPANHSNSKTEMLSRMPVEEEKYPLPPATPGNQGGIED